MTERTRAPLHYAWIVAGTTFYHGHPIGASAAQLGDIDRRIALNELDCIVAAAS